MSPRPLPYESAVATGRGDDGTTGLLFGGERVRKDDPRTEACGALDEAVAALGMARAELASAASLPGARARTGQLAGLVLRLQRELFVVGAELATTPGAREQQRDGTTRVSAPMVEALDAVLRDAESGIELPREFVVPGETRASAALELARTIVRRAERRAVTLAAADDAIAAGHVLPYLNRLADLLWILARSAEQAESRAATAARATNPTTPRHPATSSTRSEP
jgi:cob(I)alamin adenosyltransferase